MRRFSGALLRWAAAAGAVFTLGIIATWIVQVGPRTREITRLRAELETATRDLATAHAELERLRPIEAEFLQSEQRRLALQVLVDVTRAQAALASGERAAAKTALRETPDRLSALAESLGPDWAELLLSMQGRLNLIRTEIDRDVFAAQADLSILASSLAALEGDLAGAALP
jgi:multidrug resistance efflux pump